MKWLIYWFPTGNGEFLNIGRKYGYSFNANLNGIIQIPSRFQRTFFGGPIIIAALTSIHTWKSFSKRIRLGRKIGYHLKENIFLTRVCAFFVRPNVRKRLQWIYDYNTPGHFKSPIQYYTSYKDTLRWYTQILLIIFCFISLKFLRSS